MNIFALHSNPMICALFHCDKHVVKMILEYAQLLSTAHQVLDGIQIIEQTKKRKIKRWIIKNSSKPFYKSTHVNHPCSKWVRESSENYKWLYKLFCCLCDEYSFRYKKVHKTDSRLRYILRTLPTNIVIANQTPFVQAMPQQYKNTKNPILAYRILYIHEKAHFCSWKYRITPSWFP